MRYLRRLLLTTCVTVTLLTAQQAAGTLAGISPHSWRLLRLSAPLSNILVNPLDDNIWYVSSPEGLFITRNDGDSWSKALTGQVSPEAVAIDPGNPNRVYAVAESTLFRSTDRGITWSAGHRFRSQIASLAVNLSDNSIYAGPQFSDDLSGVYKSTDRGESFTAVPFGQVANNFGPPLGRIATVIDIETDSQGCVSAVPQEQTPGVAFLQSCNGGATWTGYRGAPTSAPPAKLLFLLGMYIGGPRLGLYVGSRDSFHALTRDPVTAFAVSDKPSVFHQVYLAFRSSTRRGLFTTDFLGGYFPEPAEPPYQYTSMGLDGEFTALTLNAARTKLYAVSSAGSLWVGEIDKPSLTSRAVYVNRGSTLRVSCEACKLIQAMPELAFSSFVLGATLSPQSAPPFVFQIPAGAAAGVYPARLTSSGAWTVPFDLVLGDPAPRILRLTDLRFQTKPAFARGELVSLFGSQLNGRLDNTVSQSNIARMVPWESDVALSRITVDGQVVPMQFSMTDPKLASQINFQIPPGLREGNHVLQVHRLTSLGNVEASSSAFPFTVRSASPTYLGNEAIPLYVQNVTQDPTGNVFVTGGTPAFPGDVGIVYATGLGLTSPVVPVGEVPPSGVTARVNLPITAVVRSGASLSWTTEILGAVASPQFPGLYQIAFRFPQEATPAGGEVQLILAAGDDTQTFNLNFSVR